MQKQRILRDLKATSASIKNTASNVINAFEAAFFSKNATNLSVTHICRWNIMKVRRCNIKNSKESGA